MMLQNATNRQQQSEMLEGFNEMDTLTDHGFLPGMCKEEFERVAQKETWAIRLSHCKHDSFCGKSLYLSKEWLPSYYCFHLGFSTRLVIWVCIVVYRLFHGNTKPLGDEFHLRKEQEKWVVDIMLSVTLVKLLLVIFCRTFTNEIVKAYAQDHFFDVITNVIGLVAALLANYVQGWINPVGAIVKLLK
ncbi:metal tolerance protein 5-like isoform X1 [Panicum miliaceum]|uniref:Metal tolerance protein 5-like isoform X1 n=1 Tax=Panicum miliaceum TaxID=4540 RepID=A0A3L6SZJ6_PANMI|nr:metal tolerance protein 5-like isoform X1 [Panicum miliaceum]